MHRGVDLVWNRLSFAKFHKIADGKAVRRHGIPGGGAEQNGEADWIVIPNAHPALITREQFDTARAKREDRRKSHGGQSYRVGQGAQSQYLLSGLIQCDRCGHYWQGYAVSKGKPRKDGTKVKTYYYGCNGYISKGNTVCTRSVIAQEVLENWVLDQIDEIIQRYLREGGDAELRAMIRQELTATAIREGGEAGVTLETIAARKDEISRNVSATLQSIDEANREFVNAHLTALREEMAALQQQEEVIHRQAAQREMLDEAVDSQYSLACQRIGMARNVLLAGTIEEQRLIIRAFLRKIHFDPDTRTGTAEFWLIPGAGNEDPRRNPAGRGRRTDIGSMDADEALGMPKTQCTIEQRLISVVK